MIAKRSSRRTPEQKKAYGFLRDERLCLSFARTVLFCFAKAPGFSRLVRLERVGAVERRENFSQKRAAILNTLQKTDVHPTAEWVYEALQPQYPNLSLGTVYRNLKRFCEEGKAASVGVINGQEHFDGTVTPHAHFICTKCGTVTDIPRDYFAREELEKLSESTGFQVESASVIFRGVCSHCREEMETHSE